mmetsp:Transcript_30952/g.70930  ORF Transcript_30952/g.70930 Transcript_30952/m.70930 type:complete len:87 (+) Transcript_30952:95-355(+)
MVYASLGGIVIQRRKFIMRQADSSSLARSCIQELLKSSEPFNGSGTFGYLLLKSQEDRCSTFSSPPHQPPNSAPCFISQPRSKVAT